MFLREFFVFSLVLAAVTVRGQADDFCDAVMTISRDAPNDFRNIRGGLVQRGAGATIWGAGIKVPGGLAARFVSSMGLFYECALLQTKKKEDVGPAYEKYRKELSECLTPGGYELSRQPNFYPGMDAWKKLVFIPQVKGDISSPAPPSHVTLEATYNKDIGLYTVVLYIFQH